VSDIPDGGRIIVDVRGRSIGVFNVSGEFHALLNRCPTRAPPSAGGRWWDCSNPTSWGIPLRQLAETPAVPLARLGVRRHQRAVVLRPDAHEECVTTRPESRRETRYGRASPRVRRPIRPTSRLRESSSPSPSDPARERAFKAELVPVSVEDDYVVVSMR